MRDQRHSAFGLRLLALTLLALMASGSNVCAVASVPKPGHEKKRDAKKDVEALEEQWRVAQLAGDVVAMDKLLSDDYIGISMTGQVNTKAQQLERLRNRVVMLKRLDLGERKVKLVGTIAIVTSLAEVEGTNEGSPMTGTYRYTRVYQYLTGRGWKITSFEATRVPQNRNAARRSEDGTSAEQRPK